jgi:hypothetical protein
MTPCLPFLVLSSKNKYSLKILCIVASVIHVTKKPVLHSIPIYCVSICQEQSELLSNCQDFSATQDQGLQMKCK